MHFDALPNPSLPRSHVRTTYSKYTYYILMRVRWRFSACCFTEETLRQPREFVSTDKRFDGRLYCTILPLVFLNAVTPICPRAGRARILPLVFLNAVTPVCPRAGRARRCTSNYCSLRGRFFLVQLRLLCSRSDYCSATWCMQRCSSAIVLGEALEVRASHQQSTSKK